MRAGEPGRCFLVRRSGGVCLPICRTIVPSETGGLRGGNNTGLASSWPDAGKFRPSRVDRATDSNLFDSVGTDVV